MIYNRDFIAFVNNLNSKQKLDLLDYAHHHGDANHKEALAGYIKKGKFPSNREILKGGGVWSAFKNAV